MGGEGFEGMRKPKKKAASTGVTRLFYREQKPHAQYRLVGIATAVATNNEEYPPFDWRRRPSEIRIPVYALPDRIKHIDKLRGKRKKIDWKLEFSDRKTRAYWEARVIRVSFDEIQPISANILMRRTMTPVGWVLPK